MPQHLEQWRRAPRASLSLGADKGVYALFLRTGAMLPGIQPREDGLLYIGLAGNRDGLKGRCHFDARTVNHSPRKSLAVLLKEELSLRPVLVPKPSAADTWGLDRLSDARLTEWMHANLILAIQATDDPEAVETELVCLHAPPLNLTKCVQTEQHRTISRARSQIMASLQSGGATPAPVGELHPATPIVGRERTARLPSRKDETPRYRAGWKRPKRSPGDTV